MDDEEVDIATVRNLAASSWIPPYLQVETSRLSPSPVILGGLTSPSAPDIIEDSGSNQLRASPVLGRSKTLANLRHKSGAISDPDLSGLDNEQLAQIRRWILGIAVGK